MPAVRSVSWTESEALSKSASESGAMPAVRSVSWTESEALSKSASSVPTRQISPPWEATPIHGEASGCAEMRVNRPAGAKVLRISMSMPASMAGATVGAYSTLAPCSAISKAAR